MAKLSQEQFQVLRDKGLSVEQIISLQKGEQSVSTVNRENREKKEITQQEAQLTAPGQQGRLNRFGSALGSFGKALTQSERRLGGTIGDTLFLESREAEKLDAEGVETQNMRQSVISRIREKTAKGEDTSRLLDVLGRIDGGISAGDITRETQGERGEQSALDKTKGQILGESGGVLIDALSAGVPTGVNKGSFSAIKGAKSQIPLLFGGGQGATTALKGTFKGLFQGAVGGAAFGAGEGALRALQDEEDAGQGALVGGAIGGIAGGVLGAIGGGIQGRLNSKTVKGGTDKTFRATKPNITRGKKLNNVRSNFERANLAVTEHGLKPQNYDEYVNALTETRKGVWELIDDGLKKADGTGSKVNLKPIAEELKGMASDPNILRQNSTAAKRIQDIADDLISQGDEVPVSVAEDLKQLFNADLKGQFGTVDASSHVVNAKKAITKKLGEDLDEIISTVPGEFSELKRTYGALREVEDAATKRQIVFSRANPQDLQESISKARGVGNIVKGVFTLSPSDVLQGASEVVTSQVQKRANDADFLIKSAFDDIGNELGSDAAVKAYIANLQKQLSSQRGFAANPFGDVTEDATRKAIQSSQAFNLQKAIDAGDIPRASVFQGLDGDTLVPKVAQGRIDDIAQKLDRFRPGLGDTFRGSVDVNNTTLKKLIEIGESTLDQLGASAIVAGKSAANVTPELVAKRIDKADRNLIAKFLDNPNDLNIDIEGLLEQIGIGELNREGQLRFLREVLGLSNL